MSIQWSNLGDLVTFSPRQWSYKMNVSYYRVFGYPQPKREPLHEPFNNVCGFVSYQTTGGRLTTLRASPVHSSTRKEQPEDLVTFHESKSTATTLLLLVIKNKILETSNPGLYAYVLERDPKSADAWIKWETDILRGIQDANFQKRDHLKFRFRWVQQLEMIIQNETSADRGKKGNKFNKRSWGSKDYNSR